MTRYNLNILFFYEDSFQKEQADKYKRELINFNVEICCFIHFREFDYFDYDVICYLNEEKTLATYKHKKILIETKTIEQDIESLYLNYDVIILKNKPQTMNVEKNNRLFFIDQLGLNEIFHELF